MNDSDLCKLLCSNYFKDEKKGHTKEQIDTNLLRLFAILHCSGKPYDKAVGLLDIILDGGPRGHEFHDYVAANDKDFAPAFEKLCAFSTWELFTSLSEIKGVKSLYDENEIESIKNQVENLRETDFLDPIYGFKSRVENKQWLNIVSK